MIFLTGASLLLGWWTWRLDDTRKLFWLVLAAAFAQALVSGAMYALSLSPPDFLKAKVLSPGFWVPFGDAQNYFLLGQKVVTEGFAVAARHPPSALYVSLLGLASLGTSHPLLSGFWLNGLLHLALMPLSFQAFRSFSNAAALGLAFGLGFLPSSLLYTSQLLREALIWLLLFGAIVLMFFIKNKNGENVKWRCWFGVSMVIALLTETRIWMGYIFGLSAVALICFKSKPILNSFKARLLLVVLGGIFLGKNNLVSGVLEKIHPKTVIGQTGRSTFSEQKKTTEGNYKLLIKNYYNFGIQRFLHKKEELLREPKTFFTFLLAADLSFAAMFCLIFRKVKIVFEKDIPSFRVYSLFVLAAILFSLFASIVFAENIGNWMRYICPVLLLCLFQITMCRIQAKKPFKII